MLPLDAFINSRYCGTPPSVLVEASDVEAHIQRDRVSGGTMYLVGPRVQGDRVSGGTTYRVGPCLQRDRVSEGPRIWWDRVYRGTVYLRDHVSGGTVLTEGPCI